MKDLQKIKEFFSKPLKEERDIYDEIANEEFGMDYDQLGPNEKEWVRDEISNIKEGNHNAEDFKPYVVKDTNNPNFLKIFIQYPTGTGFTTALGQRTMTGQDREYGAAKAMKIGQAVAAKLESQYNIEDIEVSDNDAGKVIVFAVSDDFIKMNTPSIDESVSQEVINKVSRFITSLANYYDYSEQDAVYAIMQALKTTNFQGINEAKEEDAVDTITMDIPLFLRMLEYSREDASQDMDLHDVTEKANLLGKERGILSMDDYEEIVGAAEEIDEAELTEANVPSNIAEFAKRKGVSSLVRKVAGWAEKVGARIAGGTAVGKNYSTLVLDLDYKQQGEIRIDTDEETVTLYDEPINNFNQFERVYRYGPVSEEKDLEEGEEEQLSFISKARAKSSLRQFLSGKRDDGLGKFDAIVYGIDSDGKKHQIKYYNHLQDYEKFALGNNPDVKENVAPNHNGKAAPYGSGYKPLEERIAKALEQINEDLCPAGKAYIKRRQAAGEKSSAYLSGRAVKVCKGQMSGRAKKKK